MRTAYAPSSLGDRTMSSDSPPTYGRSSDTEFNEIESFVQLVKYTSIFEYLHITRDADAETTRAAIEERRRWAQAQQGNPKVRDEARWIVRNYTLLSGVLLERRAAYLWHVEQRRIDRSLALLGICIDGALADDTLTPDGEAVIITQARSLGVPEIIAREHITRVLEERGLSRPPAVLAPPPSAQSSRSAGGDASFIGAGGPSGAADGGGRPGGAVRTRPGLVLGGLVLILLSMGLGALMNTLFQPSVTTTARPAIVEEPKVITPVAPEAAPPVVEAAPAVAPEVALAVVSPSEPAPATKSSPPAPRREDAPPPTPAAAPAREAVAALSLTTASKAPPPVAPAAPTVVEQASAAPAAPAAPRAAATSPAPSRLDDLELSVSGGRVVLKGLVGGVGQRAAGVLIEDEGVCEYRIKLSNTDLGQGVSGMPVASSVVRKVSVSQRDGSTYVTLTCTPGAGTPQLSASAQGFTLIFQSS